MDFDEPRLIVSSQKDYGQRRYSNAADDGAVPSKASELFQLEQLKRSLCKRFGHTMLHHLPLATWPQVFRYRVGYTLHAAAPASLSPRPDWCVVSM